MMHRIATLLTSIALVAGCKSKSDPQPDVPDASRIDAKVVVVDAAPDAPPLCYLDAGLAGCFQCVPVNLEDFLNACTDGTCVAFNNVARLPLYNNGNLPPLPP